MVKSTPARPSGWVALCCVLVVGAALPGESRVFTSAVAAVRAAWRGGSVGTVAWAFIRPRGLGGWARGADDSPAVPAGPVLRPPPTNTPPHEAALARAYAQGWGRCGPSAEACVAVYRRLVTGKTPADVALERVMLGDPDGVRVDAAVEAARAAELPEPQHPNVHAPFLPDADAALIPNVQRTLTLARLWTLQWPLPVGTRITSPFGERMHPVLGRRVPHQGVDMEAALNTPLHAPAAARVVHVGTDTAEGLYVVLDHGFGVQSVSCHLLSTPLVRHQKVEAGAVYAFTGASGRVTGPHLHYGVRVSGTFVDPTGVTQRR